MTKLASRRVSIGMVVVLLGLYALHQDFWNWHATGRVFGLPIGMAYHVAYCLVAATVLAYLTRNMGRDSS